MRILKSKSRFPNRTHPKNNHAFFLRSFVLVVCLLVFLFFLYSHRPLSSADIHSRVIGFPLRKVGAGETTEHFRARTHSRHASLTLAKPLYASAEERAAGSTWVVCLHKGFWEELILILIYPRPNLFQLQSAGRWSWLDLICGRAVEHVACCAHHQPKRRTLYHAATRTAGENEKINPHQVIKILVLTSHGDFR